ncbi:hypothetical protein H1R17_12325 [Flavobacterium sp. xlx-214]|uniref:PH domain-containing protein n=1 Tax=unclassified Flavobacterium TaxID=196869 RepID=UPI0013D12198|nr:MULTISPECIES: PH domain-containing protein [unclassified Flavobacterium]MBA5793748.1 hypothetical protein [Flavobacterium sp. xlx-221]QMI83231.1 hypothetical protein H1R17_12325 [Flavobacterium sp. xlx-214]
MFKASLGTSIKVTTIIIVVLLVSIILLLFFLFIISLLSNKFENKDVMMPILAFGIFGVLLYTFNQRIKGYNVSTEGIKVIKRKGSDFIKKETIVELKPITYKDIRFSIRTFGIGGVFSMSGSFTNNKFGDMTWYITRKDSLLMIITQKEKFVISPDAPQDFIKEVEKLLNENPA